MKKLDYLRAIRAIREARLEYVCSGKGDAIAVAELTSGSLYVLSLVTELPFGEKAAMNDRVRDRTLRDHAAGCTNTACPFRAYRPKLAPPVPSFT